MALLTFAPNENQVIFAEDCRRGPARRRPLWVKGACPAQAICTQFPPRDSPTRTSLRLDPEAATYPILKSNLSKNELQMLLTSLSLPTIPHES